MWSRSCSLGNISSVQTVQTNSTDSVCVGADLEDYEDEGERAAGREGENNKEDEVY